ncbi:uncharacterized protein LOC135130923 isoform X2 [Zophobas morio]|uniref:uncharacterized protein LOC135130923 isoform X2 n=1 Tax=Zophobas morio TaxID=2755281 RepID=UPI003083AB98
MYFTQHIRYQLMILINHIENLTDVAGTKREDKLFYDESYQEEIRKRLIFCFKRFKDFVLFTANKYAQLSNAVIIFMLTGYLLCVSVALNIIFGNILSYMRVTVMSVGTVSGLAGLMWSSQSLENIFEELLSEAIKINWYNFSESNKRMYLIFLVHLARDRKIKFSANYCLNYGLGLALMYFTQHIRYQLMILINHIENLTDVAGTKREDKLFYDESYQEETRKRLIFCFKRFKDFVLFTANKYTQLSNAVIIFMLTGYLLCVSVALNIIFGNILSYMRVTVMSVGTVSGLCGLMWSSQSLENIFEELLSEAIKINWYNFSESNKRMYLIFLVHLARDRKIKFSANYCLNYGLGLASARATYSIVSVAINIF